MSRRIVDLIFAGLILGGSLWFWVLATQFPVSRRYASVDTGFWPSIVFCVLTLVSGALVLQNLRALHAMRGSRDVPAERPSTQDRAETRARVVRIALISGLIILYFLAFRLTGFFLATILFLWAASFLLSRRNAVAKLVFAPLFTLALTLLFSRALSLPLPRGTGSFYALNLMLY